jgi:hypothetical protein
MRDDLLADKPVDDEQLVRAANASARLLSVLGLKSRKVRKHSDELSSLDAYLQDWRRRKDAAGEKADASDT